MGFGIPLYNLYEGVLAHSFVKRDFAEEPDKILFPN